MSHAPTEPTFTDPVCGMEVTAQSSAGTAETGGTTYYFCSAHCQNKFATNPAAFVKGTDGSQGTYESHECCATLQEPAAHCCSPSAPSTTALYFCPMCPGVESDRPGACPKCGMALEPAGVPASRSRTTYTCPMHPEIEEEHPGACPICGMALEPKTMTAEPEDDDELRDMTRRFSVGAALTLPVFLLAMAHLLPSPPAWTMSAASRWTQLLLSTPVVLWAGLATFSNPRQAFTW